MKESFVMFKKINLKIMMFNNLMGKNAKKVTNRQQFNYMMTVKLCKKLFATRLKELK